MPVEKPDVVDFVAHNPSTNEVVLVMVETRDWSQVPEGLPQLEAKFSAYANCILSGAFAQQQPEFANCLIRIELSHFSPITEPVAGVLRKWAGRLSGIPVAVCSHRMYWDPMVNFFRKLAAKLAGPQYQRVRWTAEPGETEQLLTPAQFAEEFAVALRNKMPTIQVQIIQSLEIKVTNANGKETKVFLDNAYTRYRITPENKAELIQKYGEAFLETATAQDQPVDQARIVPIIKDRAWINDLKKGLKARGGQESPEQVHEAYNEELIIVYAVDTPTNIRYLSTADLGQLQLKTSGDLRKLACANLERLLPAPDIQQENGLYRIKAGGDYDASLLLLESLWTTGKIPVAGETVAAIPARDFLAVTGSEDASGMKKIRAIAQTVAAQAPYHLNTAHHEKNSSKMAVILVFDC
jgi:uncharacterized protein YtpQ (UPF0354 family)